MAEYKQIDLQIGTEAQFESKKETLPVGTFVGITDPIHKSELDSDLQTLINGKLTAPTTPTADSAVTMLADGTVATKALSEFSGKLYLHTVPFKKSDNSIKVNIIFYSLSDQSTSDSMLINITKINGLLYKGEDGVGKPLVGVFYPNSEDNFDVCDFNGIDLVTGQTVEATSAKFIKQNETITEI